MTVETRQIGRRPGVTLARLLPVLGPGLLAGLSDDDPAGITTYSVLGTTAGYELIWVLVLSTAALLVFHSLGARMGIVTGQGLVGLVRQRYGARAGAAVLATLLLANVGTTCAEYAGVAAGAELFGVSRRVAVPLALLVVTTLVLRSSFHRVEHVLMAVAAVFISYVAAGIMAHPDWAQVAHGTVVPTLPSTRDALVICTATIGTTLAPWGLSFIQSYAVDKRLRLGDLVLERVDVVVGSLLTGVIGIFVVIACAATLHPAGVTIEDASDAAQALAPLAGQLSSVLFGAGLIGAGLLAAAVLPLSTAYSVCEFLGFDSALDDTFRDAPTFYVTFLVVSAAGAAIVLIPGAPLITVLVMTQVLNAVLLLPILVFMVGLSRDRNLMGPYVSSRLDRLVYAVTIAIIAACVLTLLFVEAASVTT